MAAGTLTAALTEVTDTPLAEGSVYYEVEVTTAAAVTLDNGDIIEITVTPSSGTITAYTYRVTSSLSLSSTPSKIGVIVPPEGVTLTATQGLYIKVSA